MHSLQNPTRLQKVVKPILYDVKSRSRLMLFLLTPKCSCFSALAQGSLPVLYEKEFTKLRERPQRSYLKEHPVSLQVNLNVLFLGNPGGSLATFRQAPKQAVAHQTIVNYLKTMTQLINQEPCKHLSAPMFAKIFHQTSKCAH